MNKIQPWLKNWQKQIRNVFTFTFIKHLFKRRNVLHTAFLVEKVINHIVLLWTTGFNVNQVKKKPLEVCVTSKVVGFLEFYIFPGYKVINMLLVILFTVNVFT